MEGGGPWCVGETRRREKKKWERGFKPTHPRPGPAPPEPAEALALLRDSPGASLEVDLGEERRAAQAAPS